jgi:hypothetical protein
MSSWVISHAMNASSHFLYEQSILFNVLSGNLLERHAILDAAQRLDLDLDNVPIL